LPLIRYGQFRQQVEKRLIFGNRKRINGKKNILKNSKDMLRKLMKIINRSKIIINNNQSKCQTQHSSFIKEDRFKVKMITCKDIHNNKGFKGIISKIINKIVSNTISNTINKKLTEVNHQMIE
jgi:hypothetical protein